MANERRYRLDKFAENTVKDQADLVGSCCLQ